MAGAREGLIGETKVCSLRSSQHNTTQHNMAWTDDFPNHDYQVTLDSDNQQCSLWPTYLPEDNTRLFVIERSKNANLVNYYANMDGDRISAQDPIRGQWDCFGWTGAVDIGEMSWTQKKMAYGWGAVEVKEGTFEVSLTALPSRMMTVTIQDGVPVILGSIDGHECRVVKLYVSSSERFGLLPVVHYLDIYGFDLETNEQRVERIEP